MNAVVLTLAAAVLFAVGTVLQQRVTVTASAKEARDTWFLVRLARRPAWLAGIAADGLGFGCHAAALAAGRLAVVQPLLATTLVFTLPLGAWLDHRRVDRRELAAAVVMTGGLALFLLLANPSGGHDDASPGAWAVALLACGLVAGLCRGLAHGAGSRGRAIALGSGSGVLFGLTAALTKATVGRVDDGITHLVVDWHVWALVVVGYASMALAQASLQAGALGPAVATQTALDPVTSLLLGVLAFGEVLDAGPLASAGALLGLVLMLAGIVALALARDGAGDRTEATRVDLRSAAAAVR